MNLIKKISVHVILPLLFGFVIYILFRPVLNYSFNNILGEVLTKLKFSNLGGLNFSYWVSYNLPDALWAYSLVSGIILVWGNNYNLEKYFWIIGAFLLGLSLETFQLFHILPGTFDYLDIIFITLGISFAVFLDLNKKEKLK